MQVNEVYESHKWFQDYPLAARQLKRYFEDMKAAAQNSAVLMSMVMMPQAGLLSGRASLPRTEGAKAAPQGRAEREGRAGQRPRRAPGKRPRCDPGQQEGRGGRLASRPGRRRAGEERRGARQTARLVRPGARRSSAVFVFVGNAPATAGGEGALRAEWARLG
ncbi:hypothetical protein THAOC_25878 [Thalassiosira oceanica]|uniref:Uncharacterized protein n=1 Tax=Thalassiosira oceanica TaxID=159749 RepID=K0RMW9_THAOC|nr:hypothetical protein THAOC_25878 [Thalassiosira oceanica]|eukprot:EJK54490.1 hypothetical protein THAOC_25878 [Thalassiosira oceanica]